nr:MAG TPA: hypothetical protein [Crassvirales sp.]
MEDIIKLETTGENSNYLKKLKRPDGSESRTYVLKVTDPYVTITKTPTGGHASIGATGSNLIVVGEELKEAKAVVKSIDFTIGYGYTITFY